ncbi:helix-turn-helix domain-containing protein [Streptomyces sp. NRRL B-1677]|uniref:ArsR family transcriptional regulator n=1 Tax=Streptomyces klenkii TaxID=1420899 RepID=A0A3B0BFC7_9ACTN|nr:MULTISPECIES: DUF5937 family protein [Streptomyces]MBF6047957.1 helix-turn-helix domain-containing protein [Streptomyces sp. NRRL B-1677]RKN71452.1 ArsR family transcriptional regulator [Streptomyces klenkii]
MLELEFTARDLAHTRFAVSPLWEVVASVRVLRRPDEHPLHRPWLTAVRPRLAAARLDWRLLADLVPEGPLAIPVFVAPPPTSSVPDLGVELAALRATPPEQVRAELDGPRAPRTERVEALRQDPEAELARLADTVAAYWELALAPYWPRLRALLEGDVLHRARLLAQGGIQHVFTDLDPRVSWTGERLSVEHRYGGGGRRLGGRGLLLIPSAFVWPRLFSVTVPGRQPTLRYPPRGVAALWERREREPAQALAAVLGRSRARLLTELDAPAATAELARRTGITAGGVSQHLGALRAAGLVAAARAGRQVLYRRTEAAEVLLAAADRDPS